jgi:hypothetical protein
MAKKKVVKKKEEFTEAMQDNILMTTLLNMVRHTLELEDTYPYISYWPGMQSIEFQFLEEAISDEQIQKFASLTNYPKEGPMNGRPMYSIRVYTEVYDREKQVMAKLNGKMIVQVDIDFTKHDWELMTKGKRGELVDLKEEERYV